MPEQNFVQYLVIKAIDIYIFVIIIRAILSWFSSNSNNSLYRFIIQLTEPLLFQIRRFLPKSRVDFSPLIAIILLSILQQVINGL